MQIIDLEYIFCSKWQLEKKKTSFSMLAVISCSSSNICCSMHSKYLACHKAKIHFILHLTRPKSDYLEILSRCHLMGPRRPDLRSGRAFPLALFSFKAALKIWLCVQTVTQGRIWAPSVRNVWTCSGCLLHWNSLFLLGFNCFIPLFLILFATQVNSVTLEMC